MKNNKRLIDANALKERLENLEAQGGNKYYQQGMNDALHDLMPIVIAHQPTVDAVEVVHGYWDTDRFGLDRSICSVCGACYEGDGGNYCRRCGAKMDGGNEDG